MSTPSALVVSRSCRSTDGRQDEAGAAVLGASGPPPPSACNWPTAVRRAAISPFGFSSKLRMSSSAVRPSKAALEQNPSSPRALGDSFRESPYGHKRSKIIQAGHVSGEMIYYMLQFRWRCAECQILSLLVHSPVSSSPPPHLNNRPLSALLSPTRHYTSPSPPSIPLPVLWTPRHLSALMPPSPVAVVTWCLNSSSLNSATST